MAKTKIDDLREKVRRGLKRHHGSIVELARRRGRTDRWIRYVLNGRYEDWHTLNLAVDLIAEEDAAKAQGKSTFITKAQALN